MANKKIELLTVSENSKPKSVRLKKDDNDNSKTLKIIIAVLIILVIGLVLAIVLKPISDDKDDKKYGDTNSSLYGRENGTNEDEEEEKVVNEEDYKEHSLTCYKKRDEGGYLYNTIIFDNNKIISLEDGLLGQAKKEYTNEEVADLLRGLEEANEGLKFHYGHNGTTYKFYTYIPEDQYMENIFGDDEGELSYSNLENIIKSFEETGYECILDY